jgi:general secretion pathway protein E
MSDRAHLQNKPPHHLSLEQVLSDLRQDGFISQVQYDGLYKRAGLARGKNTHPLVSVADMNWDSATVPPFPLTLERLTRWLAARVGLDYVHIDPLKTDFSKLTQQVSYAYAARFNILPLACDERAATVAVADPYAREWEADLAHVLKQDIRRVLINPLDLNKYLHEFYSIQYSVQDAGKDKRYTRTAGSGQNFEQLLELGARGATHAELDAGDQHIIHIVDWLLQYAFEQRASDIHIEPRREQGRVRFRIDGVLHLVREVPMTVMNAMTSRIKMLGRMDLAERRRPQDGRIKTRAPETGKEVELRLSTMPTTFGEKLVMRIFDPEILVKDFRALGFSKHDIERWQAMTRQPHGIMLVTGPTGSGKTSTLYSALKHLARPEINICTIEDPIEIVQPDFNQMQVNPAIDVDFADGVRTLLRQDPDIIMVGEIRDRATAEVSIQAALTGHLVLSTLHTNDAPSAITRLLDIGVPPYLINAALLGIVAQRLVRLLCPHCKQHEPTDAAKWQALVAPFSLKMPAEVYLPQGCEQCRHTGFRGRTGLFEIMTMDSELERIIAHGADLNTIRHHALKTGMRPLRLSGAQKIAAAMTTFAEVFNVVKVQERFD